LKKILITGAKGFLGSYTVKHFKALGYETYGIGHNVKSKPNTKQAELDYWIEDNVSIKAILEFQKSFDVIIHCAGSGSVSYSLEHPDGDFEKTVDGTLEVLEYIKIYNPKAQLIYPSSPAVQGEHPDKPINEEYIGKPASPYGYHKKIVEELCQSYSKEFGLNISIIRLFSIYGNGLKKQLLWDACKKVCNAKDEVIFWGTGKETRDFIHISDVLSLFEFLVRKNSKYLLINGGSGTKYTVRKVVEMIRDLLCCNVSINFDNQVNRGNPMYYWADTKKLDSYGYTIKKNLNQELKNYIEWVKSLDD
tara:strand:- start:3743 stop:4660 length:918 start_codon:yes stop_codon:yes gene_type:complete